MVVRAEMLTAE